MFLREWLITFPISSELSEFRYPTQSAAGIGNSVLMTSSAADA
jgi:hypothetical protein